jgi:ADP-ribosyl-[dinitrogen reductase] hydrolase
MAFRESAVVGALLGTAVGDALGLPYEGLTRRRAMALFGEPDHYHFLVGHGMVSDDTEHACMVLQSLLAAGDDVDGFARQLASRLRLWLLGLPAGVGLATLRATLKLWMGIPPQRSGVYSAGNGPAMRSPVLGAAIEDLDLLRRIVRASTRITHTDPKAEHGALAVALAARLAGDGLPVEPRRYREELQRLLAQEPAEELLALIEKVESSVVKKETTAAFAASLGLEQRGTGYVLHTVPVALHVWLTSPHDFRSAVTNVICCGGDTDTTAAIVGGIVRSAVGKEGIPQAWLEGLWEWPRSVAWMEQLAKQVTEARGECTTSRPPGLAFPGLLIRNLLFLAVVLLHGFRRLLPPY